MIRNLTRATRFVNNFHSSIQRYNNYKILQASSPLVNMHPRWFSTKHDAEESVQEVDHVQIETPEGKLADFKIFIFYCQYIRKKYIPKVSLTNIVFWSFNESKTESIRDS